MEETRLTLTMEPVMIPAFYRLLGHGFSVSAPSGCSIKAYLCTHLNIDSNYFDDRIQTLFLDGMAVDDPETAVLRPDSVLALSGAMPGLAGATLRRGGFYGRLRGEISYDRNSVCEISGECMIRVKLFNLVIRDLGPLFLKKGILIDADLLSELLMEKHERLKNECRGVELNGKPIRPEQLSEMEFSGKEVFLKIQTPE